MSKKLNSAHIRECVQCGIKFKCFAARVRAGGGRFCSMECRDTHNVGVNHHRHVPEYAYSLASGYMIRRDKQTGKNVRQHREIVELEIGRKLTSDEVVHHINGIKCDNRVENLMVVGRYDHSQIHKKLRFAKWSQSVNECRNCRSSELPHFAKGLCRTCYARLWYLGKTPNVKHRNSKSKHAKLFSS